MLMNDAYALLDDSLATFFLMDDLRLALGCLLQRLINMLGLLIVTISSDVLVEIGLCIVAAFFTAFYL